MFARTTDKAMELNNANTNTRKICSRSPRTIASISPPGVERTKAPNVFSDAITGTATETTNCPSELLLRTFVTAPLAIVSIAGTFENSELRTRDDPSVLSLNKRSLRTHISFKISVIAVVCWGKTKASGGAFASS